ncbi:T9SS type A sorting domain-containing protein [Flavobacterium sp. xlx-214]|uniref:Ig-like domain-containing protein n=1 Tax=unclassified Flavobacterium TaxID=196869 RepID=UPI0013D6BB36|nr:MULTISPECIES: T9SS type A sorting domain-containing protein [unclassified Flavobacterium]MBA5793624.1 T9SS type A sorting domain-containing protein [Flavobacterium sp. xlx-221]QMI84553.1 T9SS type A sorting domain-containing protein [Flavobacterium sp. xlx-214]
MRKIYLLLLALLLSIKVFSQVNLYTFSQSNGTYQEITGGTVLASPTGNTSTTSVDTGNWNVTIPFSFNFNGTNHTTVNVGSNGSVIFPGTTATYSGTVPISTTTAYAGAISAWGRDINGYYDATGAIVSNISWAVEGAAPNRTLVIQYKNARPVYSVSITDVHLINFQIRLTEGTNVIKIVYGPYSSPVSTSNPSGTIEVGLRGATNTDFNNRLNATTVNFNSSVVGTLNSSTQAFNADTASNAKMPVSGLTYIYTPPLPCSGTPSGGTVTAASQIVCAGTTPAAISVVNPNPGFPGFTYQWEQSNDNGVTDPWVNAVGGSGATTLTYTPPSFAGTTNKYYRLKVTCTASGLSATSTVHTVLMATNPSPATNLRFPAANVLDDSMTIEWDNGNGNRRIVVVNSVNTFAARTDLTGVAAYTAAAKYATAGTEQIVYDGTGTSVTVTGLLCNTTYYVKVYEYVRCGTSPSYNVWHAVSLDGNQITKAFNTTATALPASVNFTGFTGANLSTVFPGWLERIGDGPLTGTTSAWTSSTVFTGTTSAKINLFSNTKKDWIISPYLTINAVSLVKFKAAITDLSSAAADPAGMQGTDDTVEVMISEDICGAVWTPLYTFNAANTTTLTNVLTDFIVNIPSQYVGKNVRIGFKANEGSVNDTPDYDFHIATIAIENRPACPDVLNVTATAVTKNGLKVSWLAANPAPSNGYEYEIRTSGTPGTPGAVQSGPVATGVLFKDVVGLNPETDYKVYVRTICDNGDKGAWSQEVSFKTLCNYPDLVGTTPGSVCGFGTVNLAANYALGTVNWYTAATGGNPVATGSTFTTPVLNATTSYWVNSVSNFVNFTGGKTTFGTSATTPLNYGLVFSATSNFKLRTVDVYLASTTAGNLVVNLTDSSGAVLDTRTIALPAGGTATNPVLHTVTLDFDIPVGVDYRLIAVSGPSMIRDSSGATYPYPLSTYGAITGGYINGASATYYYFYNWQMEMGCSSPRTEVVATVTPAPALTLSSTHETICAGSSSNVVTITTGATDYDTYVVTPTAGVSGNNTTGWTFNPTVATTYTLTATQSAGNKCAKSIEIKVDVNPVPVITTNVATVDACVNNITELNATISGIPAQAVFGTGTAVTGTTSPPNPLSAWYGGNRTQLLFLASELTAQGLVAGSTINAVSWDIAAHNSQTCNDFTIRIGHATGANLTAGFVPKSGLTQVYNQTFTPSQIGLVTFNFTTPFVWDGISNVVVETVHNQGNTGNGSATTLKYSTTTFDSAYYGMKDSVLPAGAASFDTQTSWGSSGTSKNRPNTIFGLVAPVTTVWTPATDLYTDAAATVPYVAGDNAKKVYLKSAAPLNAVAYTVTSTTAANCSSTKVITVTIKETPKPVINETSFCKNATLADISVTLEPGGTVKWFDAATAGNELPGTTILVDGVTYYASQTANGCESATRELVTVVVYDTAKPTATQSTQSFCVQNQATLADIVVTGVSVKWYDSLTGGVELPSTTVIVDGTTYYATQTENNCESIERLAITTALVTTPLPTVTATKQDFCIDSNPTLIDIAVTGTDIKWYATATGGVELASSTLLVDGATYYATQTLNGCESISRVAVSVTVRDILAPTTQSAVQTLCIQNNPKLSDLQIVGTNIKWYDALAGGVEISNTTLIVSGTTYYASQTVNGCESDDRLAITANVQNTLVPTSTSNVQSFCVQTQSTLQNVQVSGSNIKWYDSLNKVNVLPMSTLLVDGTTYYASQTINGCESASLLAVLVQVHDVTSPTTANNQQAFCFQDNATLSSLSIVGSNIKWYASLTSTTELASSTALVNGTTYYATQTVSGCESVVRLPISVLVYKTNKPTTPTPKQVFCAATNPKLSNLNVAGVNVKWYSAMVGGNSLPSNHSLVHGETYYASQTLNNCESIERVAIQVDLLADVPLTTTSLTVCADTYIQSVVIDGYISSSLRWYASATTTNQLGGNFKLVNGTYYISTFTQGMCESTRTAVLVTVLPVVPQPVVTNPTICGGGTIADLIVQSTGGVINWYNSVQSTQPLAQSTVLVNGTYYVEQVLGNCKSIRKPITITVVSVAAPSVQPFNLCENATVADLHIPGSGSVNYTWFIDNVTNTPLPSTHVLTTGMYYVSRESLGCISTRAAVYVKVNPKPNAPTGNSIQTFNKIVRISDLVVNEPNVVWFENYNDALIGSNPASSNLMLIDGNTYYGVIIDVNGCISLPFAVQVNITTVGINDLDLANLKYYPNPIESEFNVSYIEPIKRIEVFTLTGQRILGKDYDSNEVKIDLSTCSSGTYIVRVQTANASQFVKVVKK